MFNDLLYKQIVYLLNSLAMGGMTTTQLADVIVLHFPLAWMTVLGEGIYTFHRTADLGDTALACIDIVNESINIRPAEQGIVVEDF